MDMSFQYTEDLSEKKTQPLHFLTGYTVNCQAKYSMRCSMFKEHSKAFVETVETTEHGSLIMPEIDIHPYYTYTVEIKPHITRST